MSTRTEVTEMTEDDVRVQFTDVFCSDCGASARMHGLHGATWKRGGPCAGTWIGVVRRALEHAEKKRTT